MLAHNVFFTLHDHSKSVLDAFVKSCQEYLSGHQGEVYFAVGPRKTEFQRDVNDLEFDVALNVVFADEAAHDAYQSAPRHHEFIAANKSNWKQVRVFDSRPAN